METEEKLKLLQLFYAGALADSVLRLGKEGILEKVTAEKKREQLASGKLRAAQLGIETPSQVFETLPAVFGCANWASEETAHGFSAQATTCTLCALAKKMGAQSPCNIHCLDPMEGLVKGISPDAEYRVLSTLWDNGECRVSVELPSANR